MAYQVTLRMQNGVEREVACYGYECHIAHSDRPDIGRIIAAHMEVCQKLGTVDYLPVEGDLIAVTFESTDHDNFFYEWLLQGNMANGEIEFATGDDIVDIFRFWDCYCVSLEETLCIGEMPMLMTVLLSPGILKRMNCEPREKVWKVSDISVKPRVVDNDEKHNSEPMVLVTSVKGESKSIVSQTVQYVVTKYNVPNVKDSDRKRVKWVIEVDGQKEYLKEQGERLDLQIKEEWQGKEIIVMPYLKQCTSNVAIKTEIEMWKLPKIFARSLTLPGKSINGDTAEDMLYKDKTIEDVLSINKLFALQVKASDESLFADLIYLTSFFSMLKEGKEHGLKIVKHFRENSGTIYTSEFMNKSFAEHETLQEFIYNDGGVIDVLNRNLRATNGNINKIDIQVGVIQSTRPKFNKPYDYFNGMKVTVDGIAAYIIYIDEYKLLSPNTYNAKLRIEIYDHYGLDKRDVEKFGYVAGFRSWYILQNIRGYKPFLTKMVHVLDIKEEAF